MKNIAVITSTRAEFGLLLPVVKKLREHENEELRVELIVTGTHLCEQFGNTIDEIFVSGLRIDEQVKISLNNDTPIDISKNQGEILIKFTDLFYKKKYSGIVILGDRYEMLAIAIAAANTMTPIFHLCGGDTTQGAMDEWIRHSITKMSYLHFPTNKESYERILQLGESPERVFDYGSTSIDNIIAQATVAKSDALASIGLSECDYAICTYHPVTMGNMDITYQIDEFLKAIKEYSSIEFIVTKSNADMGGDLINKLLDEAAGRINNLQVYSSLGVARYLSLMKYAKFVIGNSSSGIIEAPAFRIPTINIGDRQKGRLQAESIINCKEDKQSISDAIKLAMSNEFAAKCRNVISPYGDGCAADKISSKIISVINDNIDLKKSFYHK